MRRFLLLGVIVVLVVGIVIGGGYLLFQQFFGSSGSSGDSPTGDGEFGSLQPAQNSDQQFVSQFNGSGDDDSDGLINSDELIWDTDPSNPDTDGDGFLDGEEVTAGHDPLRPAPDDLLTLATGAAGVIPGTLTLEAIEQYFADDLNVRGDGGSRTSEYETQYASSLRSLQTMIEYAQKQPVIEQLPRPATGLVPDPKPDTAGSLSAYLAVADNSNALANASLYREGHYELRENDNPATFQSMTAVVARYRENLVAAPVPESAIALHTLLLGYTELLHATFDQISLWNEDRVLSLIATSQATVIDRKYYPLIRSELQRIQLLQVQLSSAGG